MTGLKFSSTQTSPRLAVLILSCRIFIYRRLGSRACCKPACWRISWAFCQPRYTWDGTGERRVDLVIYLKSHSWDDAGWSRLRVGRCGSSWLTASAHTPSRALESGSPTWRRLYTWRLPPTEPHRYIPLPNRREEP